MNRPVAELDDRVDESAMSRLRQVVSGFSNLVSEGTSSTTVAVRANNDVCWGD